MQDIGFAVAGSLAIIGLHTFLVRRNKGAFAWSLAAFGCVAAAQIVFSPATRDGRAVEAWTQVRVVPAPPGTAQPVARRLS